MLSPFQLSGGGEEGLSVDFIRVKMGCFLEEQCMLIHIGLFSRITEYSNEGHLRVTSAVSSAYYSYVSVIAVYMYAGETML